MVARRRYFQSGFTYHVLNRGALRQRLFSTEKHYSEFESLIEQTWLRFPLPIFAYQLMPNHWHFVVKPTDKEQLSAFFRFLAGTHGKRFRAEHGNTGLGHVYQDRFKSFPVQSDGHFLTLTHYVERNALRASLVVRAEDWRWSSLYRRSIQADDWLTSDWPIARPKNWIEHVNQPLTQSELGAVHMCVRRGRPYGSSQWTRETAEELGLQHALNAPGRPRIAPRNS